ncbi:MAG: spondin domain-containing protein [Gemmatimonadota bacterium]|nr:spondin domain-containing protein [Gemmatimonadota bacterium]
MKQGTSATDLARGGGRRSGALARLAGVALVATLLAACGEGNMPPVIGSISGTVTLEGSPLGGVTVALSGAESKSTETGADGTYRFADVLEGSYTVTISGFPTDAEFPGSMSVTVSESSQSPTADFAGSYIRTARVAGTVMVEGLPLSGISVALTGLESQSTQTNASGGFLFDELRGGDYAVEMSGWDPDRYVFSDVSRSFTLATGQEMIVEFAGTRAEYTFRVSIENIARPYAYFPSGQFNTPVGDDEPGYATSGKTYQFEFEAGPLARLTFATKMVHSNDFFYAPGPEGIALWDGHDMLTGDVTDQIRLWDAGTEIDQEPGEGEDQPMQGGEDTGDPDPDSNVRLAEDDWGTLPEVDSVLKVTIDSIGPYTFRVSIENVSKDHTLVTVRGLCLEVPIAPGVFVIHYDDEALFTPGEPDRGQGLEGLAEDGKNGTLHAVATAATGIIQVVAPGLYASHLDPGLLFNGGTTATAGVEAMAEDGNPGALGAEVLAKGGFRTADAFFVPEGDAVPGPLFPGRRYEFNVVAVHGERLSFVTMLVQSNDIFFATAEEGIELFPGDDPLTGIVTDNVMLWDAGTEVNGKPGIDRWQLPRQLANNTGPDEGGMIRLLDDEEFTYPAVDEMIRVTVTAVPR